MRTVWRIIAGIFKWSWWTLNFIRELVLNLFFVFLCLICLGIYFQIQHSDAQTTMVTKGALTLDLSGVIVDQPSSENKLGKLSRRLFGPDSGQIRSNSLFDVVKAIRQAKEDNNITGIVLDLHNFTGGDPASLQYIGKALREFRDKGKPVYSIGDNYSQAQYYLASFANKIYLSPQGSVDLHGFATNNLYYKTLLDKLRVTSHVFRVGTYKSAVEPFLRDDMSPEARKADSRWVNELWLNFLTTIAYNRQITPQIAFPGAQEMLSDMRKFKGDATRYAVEHKLVDEIASRPKVAQTLEKEFGFDKNNNQYNSTSIYDYTLEKSPAEKGNIAVIAVTGAIMDGVSRTGIAGGDTTAADIRKARLNPDIKAIILRVNSPGGSVTGSEVIRQEIVAARENGKPVVVSMGGMAASGGYWISAPANHIIASPSTLTGSIGIFGVVNTVENSLGAIGVRTDGVATSPLADITLTKQLPAEVQQLIQLSIENGYQNFINLVAKSRKRTPEQIDQIAQGHVWTGGDAKDNGLVDELGDFDDAISKAAELAKLQDYQLRWYYHEPDFFELLTSQLDASSQNRFSTTLKNWLPAPLTEAIMKAQTQSGPFGNFNDPKNRYALCMNCGEVR